MSDMIKCVREALDEQGLIRDGMVKTGTPEYKTKEGQLYLKILYNSYKFRGIYDYITIVKLYHIYGKNVFQLRGIRTSYQMSYNWDSKLNTLTCNGFKELCAHIDKYINKQL